MIKNIVLDMGNVCCKWDVSYIASQLASSLEEKDYITVEKKDGKTIVTCEGISAH